MSLKQIVSYEPIEEVDKKAHVLKKAMAEAIGAKWISSISDLSETPKQSQVIYISRIKSVLINNRYQHHN